MSTQNVKKTRRGLVVSDSMEKTVVIQVERKVPHKLYKKYVSRKVKYMAHDESNQCRVGDLVLIEECRPLSRRKRWLVRAVLEKAA